MPIRIDLLAQQKHLEELRRRDPVTRTAWVAGAVVALVVLAVLFLMLRNFKAAAKVAGLQNQLKNLDDALKPVRKTQAEYESLRLRTNSLAAFAANRFLWGPALDSLQYAVVDDDLRLTKLETRQSFDTLEETKSMPDPKDLASTNRVSIKMYSRVEHNAISVFAKCFSQTPDAKIKDFKDHLFNQPYLTAAMGANDGNISLGGPVSKAQFDTVDNRFMVTFDLRCKIPDKVRQKEKSRQK
jgi:hypothetical protein